MNGPAIGDNIGIDPADEKDEFYGYRLILRVIYGRLNSVFFMDMAFSLLLRVF